MGRLTKYRPLPDQAYDPRITNMERPLNVPASTGPQASILPNPVNPGWTNKNVTNQIPFQLVAGLSTRALAYNAKRCGLLIQNLDATQPLNYSFSNDLQGIGFLIGPQGAALFDFTT